MEDITNINQLVFGTLPQTEFDIFLPDQSLTLLVCQVRYPSERGTQA